MSNSDLALVVSIGSALTTLLGLLVAWSALRLSAASVPLDFRLRLEDRATQLPHPRNPSYWVKGLLVNAGTSCKAASLAVIDWQSPAHIRPGQTPCAALRENRKTFPRPENQWNTRRFPGDSFITKRDAQEEGLFYPQKMPTGTDAPVHLWLPPNVEAVEVSVKVTHKLAPTRFHNFWVTNPLFDARTRKADD